MFGRATIRLGIGPHSSVLIVLSCLSVCALASCSEVCSVAVSLQMFSRVWLIITHSKDVTLVLEALFFPCHTFSVLQQNSFFTYLPQLFFSLIIYFLFSSSIACQSSCLLSLLAYGEPVNLANYTGWPIKRQPLHA